MKNHQVESIVMAYLDEISIALNKEYTQIQLPAQAMAINNRFLKEWKIDPAQVDNTLHQIIHAILSINKKLNHSLKSQADENAAY